MDDPIEQSSGYCQDSSGKSLIQLDNILWTGLVLWKIPFHIVGNPQRRIINIKKYTVTGNSNKKRNQTNITKVQVLKSLTVAQMESVANPLAIELIDATKESSKGKQIRIKDIIEVKEGQSTNAFQAFKTRHGKSSLPSSDLCFSIVCADRTYDLYTDSSSLTAMMIEALHKLLKQVLLSLPSFALKTNTVAKLLILVITLKLLKLVMLQRLYGICKMDWQWILWRMIPKRTQLLLRHVVLVG